MKLDLIPLGICLIIKQREFKTDSGIIIPEEAKKGGSLELFEGEVLQAGPDCKNIEPGQTVLFGKNSFSTVNRFGKEFLLIYETDVVCLVDPNFKENGGNG